MTGSEAGGEQVEQDQDQDRPRQKRAHAGSSIAEFLSENAPGQAEFPLVRRGAYGAAMALTIK
jgi:hypothetical protein